MKISSCMTFAGDRNPFSWMVTLRYRGLTVTRGMESTEVILLNGKLVKVPDIQPCEVSIWAL